MPVQVTYPGVYIEELPSGSKTISGVATSITAFVGRALKGPVNDPVTIFGFDEFVRSFGSLNIKYPMAYAVQDFFMNGGGQAVIVRLFEGDGSAAYAFDEWDSKRRAARAVLDAAKSERDTPESGTATADTIKAASKAVADGETTDPMKSAAAEMQTKVEGDLATAGNETFELTSAEQFYEDTYSKRPAPGGDNSDPDFDKKKGAAKAVLDAAAAADQTDADAVKKAASDKAAEFPDDPEKSAAAEMSGKVDADPTLAQANQFFSDTYESGGSSEPATTLKLVAANPGTWANIMTATVDYDGITDEVADLFDGLEKEDLFNLNIYYVPKGEAAIAERHANLSVKNAAGDRRVDRVLKNDSLLARVPLDDKGQPDMPDGRPANVSYTFGGGDNGALLTDNTIMGNPNLKTGVHALEKTDLFNLLCIPPDARTHKSVDWETSSEVYGEALNLCVKRRAMLIMDPPKSWTDKANIGKVASIKLTDVGNFGTLGRNAAVYFPRVIKSDPMLKGKPGVFPACGMVAGNMAATDVARGVWKAPAGVDAALVGASGLEVKLTDNENGLLNPQGINCLRTFPVSGSVIWGARTLRGSDQLSDDYKYLSVRRLTLYIEESLFRGTQWAVFEPNDATLWASLKDSANGFMASLAKQGAFYTYEVTCDKSTTTARDINLGIVNMVVAFAPVKPAEFVVIKIQQQALKD